MKVFCIFIVLIAYFGNPIFIIASGFDKPSKRNRLLAINEAGINFKDMKNKYQYHLHTWGGFYNDEYQRKHLKESGNHYFDSEIERDNYLLELQNIEKELNAHSIIYTESEGYCCNVITTLHRVIEFKDKKYYSEYEMGVNYSFDAAKYHLEHKWYPGVDDYPLGEAFNYDNAEIITIQEWITGAFSELNEQ